MHRGSVAKVPVVVNNIFIFGINNVMPKPYRSRITTATIVCFKMCFGMIYNNRRSVKGIVAPALV